MTTYCLPKVRVSRAWYFAVVFLLSGCIAPALLFSPQGQLMWALLKPLVGLDPNEVNLFEQPIIKDRMQALLGPHYDTTLMVLKTAGEIQQEGPLFYVVSRYTPVPLLAEKAGFVWNAETNQMAVLLLSGGAPQVFAEQMNKQAEQVIPSWPKDLADYVNPDALKQKAINTAGAELSAAMPSEFTTVLDVATDPKAAVKAQQDAIVSSSKAQLASELNDAVGTGAAADAKAVLKDYALSPLQQQQAKAVVELKTAEQAVLAAEENVAQAQQQLQQSISSSDTHQQAIEHYELAQQRLLSARQGLEAAKAKNKALAGVLPKPSL